MVSKKIKFRIKGHEKFAVREGWLNKGIIAVDKNKDVFTRKDAPDTLGVGNNMVKSIRYWMKAFELIEEVPRRGATLTPIAQVIKSNDIYFEDTFTLWILHSQIVKNVEQATSWNIFFNNCDIEDHSKENIDEIMKNEISKYVGEGVAENSIKDDATVLLNMYSNERQENYDPEDKRISPFSELGLLSKINGVYYKKQPNIEKLSKWIILYELSCIFNGDESTNSLASISIENLCSGDNSIGSIYNLSRVVVNDYLDQIADMSYIRVDRTAGLDMVYSQFKDKPLDIIKKYYLEQK